MNDDFGPGGPFERRRSNRAILMVVGMAFAAIALNDGVHALTRPAGKRAPAPTSSPRLERQVSGERPGDSPCDDLTASP